MKNSKLLNLILLSLSLFFFNACELLHEQICEHHQAQAVVIQEAKPVEAKPVEAKPVEAKPVEAKPVESKPVEITIAEQIDVRAKALILQAWVSESEITPVLQELATAHQLELAGFEHRLKTYSSTVRKLSKMKHEKADLEITQAQTGDVLRYTILIKDQPKKNYVTLSKKIIETLESKGQLLKQLKNYWAKGDNYSGINCVFESQIGGQVWELQIHTPDSYATSKKDRALYEKMREVSTSVEEKQKLFDQMTKSWEIVKIPEGILEEKILHPNQENIKKDRPN
jgi:hypothetical protein